MINAIPRLNDVSSIRFSLIGQWCILGGLCWLITNLPLPSLGVAGSFTVVTTIFPLKEFAEAVGGERVNVTLLLPPGAEPHTWEPRPSDIVNISKADVFIHVGPAMEPWVPGILKAIDNHDLAVVEATNGFPLITTEAHRQAREGTHPQGQVSPREADPHVWLNFEYDQRIVEKIVAAFAKKDPAGAGFYARNGQAYNSKLKALDVAYRDALKNCECRAFVLGSHAAFAYLARRYGLIQVPLYGVSPNAEPTPKKMAEVIEKAKRYRVRAIFYEELVSDKLAKVMADEVGVKPLTLNPGHNLTKGEIERGMTFLALMKKNLENLRYALRCH